MNGVSERARLDAEHGSRAAGARVNDLLREAAASEASDAS